MRYSISISINIRKKLSFYYNVDSMAMVNVSLNLPIQEILYLDNDPMLGAEETVVGYNLAL